MTAKMLTPVCQQEKPLVTSLNEAGIGPEAKVLLPMRVKIGIPVKRSLTTFSTADPGLLLSVDVLVRPSTSCVHAVSTTSFHRADTGPVFPVPTKVAYQMPGPDKTRVAAIDSTKMKLVPEMETQMAPAGRAPCELSATIFDRTDARTLLPVVTKMGLQVSQLRKALVTAGKRADTDPRLCAICAICARRALDSRTGTC